MFILASFFVSLLLVAGLTYYLTRHDDHHSVIGFFLGGRSLNWPLISGSLLLTNLSTEQLVGLNGAAYIDGMAVLAWEVVAALALVCMALFFLPRYLEAGVVTLPQYLGRRFDPTTEMLTNTLFLLAYAIILLPIILYSGATGLIGLLDLQSITGIESESLILWLVVWFVGILGAGYALLGGLRTVAISDTLHGIGLLAGGLLVTWLALGQLGDGSILCGLALLVEGNGDRMSSIGSVESSVPFSTLFTGVLLLNLFYWTTNQQIIQRALAARSLEEGQKGVLMTGLLKLIGPLYLVIPGMIAFIWFPDIRADQSYGMLVNRVLPVALTGFFAAIMMGAILSSYNSALNSTCTLFTLGFLSHSQFSQRTLVNSGRAFGFILTMTSMCFAPLLAGQESLWAYLQQMNGLYFIPIFSILITGMCVSWVTARAANTALIAGIVIVAAGFWTPLSVWVVAMHEYHFLGLVFVLLILLMLLISLFGADSPKPQSACPAEVDLTAWPYARIGGASLVAAVIVVYCLLI